MIPERALSIRQPWASLIVTGNKLVENRVWDTRWRGTFAVHAGKRVDVHDVDALSDEFGLKPPHPTGYLGLVDLVDVHFAALQCCGIWALPDVYHWRLENPRLFRTPIPGLGRLGLYACPPAVQDAIEATLRESA